MLVIVGLPTHLDGRLNVKRQRLVCLMRKNTTTTTTTTTVFSLQHNAAVTYGHKLVELSNVLEFCVAVEEEGGVVGIGLTLLVKSLCSDEVDMAG